MKLALKYYYHGLLACYRIKCVQYRKHKKMKAFLYSDNNYTTSSYPHANKSDS